MKLDQTSILEGVEKKRKLFDHYYDNFEKHLFSNKLSKASEFLWGAVYALIYSLGLTYNKQLAKHRAMRDFVKEISEENDDENLYKYYKISEELHMNFYSDSLDEDGLNIKREYADKLIKKLKSLVDYRVNLIKSGFVEEVSGEGIDVSTESLVSE